MSLYARKKTDLVDSVVIEYNTILYNGIFVWNKLCNIRSAFRGWPKKSDPLTLTLPSPYVGMGGSLTVTVA